MPINRKDRAKQFLPFDALKGLQEALQEKEVEYEERKELSEESYEKLQDEFNKIETGSNVKIKYYKDRRYKTIVGTITKIDNVKKKIIISEVSINISDIIEIENV